MNYTVNKLATLSGVTIRTLRFYDKIGLLKPAFVGENGYRYYQKKELLILQQILFFRQLGFELKQIKQMLNRSDFDQCAALRTHKQQLHADIKRLRALLVTIDKTINHVEQKETMSEKEIFFGLKENPELRKSYNFFMAQEDGNFFDKYYEKAKDLTDDDKKRIARENRACVRALARVFAKGLGAESPEAQTCMQNYYELLKRQSVGLVELSRENVLVMADSFDRGPKMREDMKRVFPETYEKNKKKYDVAWRPFVDNPGLDKFMAGALRVFANKNLEPDSNNFVAQMYLAKQKMTDLQKEECAQEDFALFKKFVPVFAVGHKPDSAPAQACAGAYLAYLKKWYGKVATSRAAIEQVLKMVPNRVKMFKAALELDPELANKKFPAMIELNTVFEENPGLDDFFVRAVQIYAQKNLK